MEFHNNQTQVGKPASKGKLETSAEGNMAQPQQHTTQQAPGSVQFSSQTLYMPSGVTQPPQSTSRVPPMPAASPAATLQRSVALPSAQSGTQGLHSYGTRPSSGTGQAIPAQPPLRPLTSDMIQKVLSSGIPVILTHCKYLDENQRLIFTIMDLQKADKQKDSLKYVWHW